MSAATPLKAREVLPVVLAILGADLVAAGLLVVGRVAVQSKAGIPPSIFTWFRLLISTTLLQLWLSLTTGLAPWNNLPARQDVWKFATYGITHVLNQLLIFLALQQVPAVVPAVWKNMVPVFVCILAVVFGLERFSTCDRGWKLTVVGLLLTTIGGLAYVALGFWWCGNGSDIAGKHYNYPLGQMYMLGGTILVSFAWVMQKVCLNVGRGSAFTVAWGNTIALVLLTMIVIPEISINSFELRWAQIVYVLYAGIFPTTLGVALQAWAMKKTGPTFVMAFDPIGATITAVVSWAALGEVPSVSTLVSAPIIMLGLYFVILGHRYKEPAPGSESLATASSSMVE